MNDSDDRLDSLIDQIVESHPDGIKGDDLIDEVIAALDGGGYDDVIDVPGRTVLRDAWFAQKVRSSTRRRRNQFRVNLETVSEALSGDTLLGRDDPILTLAFPTSDGNSTMRTLRYWAIADIESIRDSSRANRVDVDRADDELADVANGVIAGMRTRRADSLGEALFG